MKKKSNARIAAVFLLLTAAFGFLVIVNLNIGSVKIPVAELPGILFGQKEAGMEYDIIWKIRLPRLLMAAILGGALALSGFLLQTFFENPIAGPFVLGISSGAKMTVAIAMIYVLERAGTMSSYSLILAAFGGAMLSTGFILLLSKKIRHMAGLLVGGIMIGYICSAVTDFVVTFADEADIVNLHGWSQGSFSGMSFGNVKAAALIAALALLTAFVLSKPIGAYQIGETYAQSMGVNVRLFRVVLILLSSVLSATVTAFAGPISFVGIAVPFLVKRGLGTANPLLVVPGTFLGGGVFCLFSDLIARTAFAPVEMSISAVTSLLGAPVVIYMMVRQRRVG